MLLGNFQPHPRRASFLACVYRCVNVVAVGLLLLFIVVVIFLFPSGVLVLVAFVVIVVGVGDVVGVVVDVVACVAAFVVIVVVAISVVFALKCFFYATTCSILPIVSVLYQYSKRTTKNTGIPAVSAVRVCIFHIEPLFPPIDIQHTNLVSVPILHRRDTRTIGDGGGGGGVGVFWWWLLVMLVILCLAVRS